MADPALPDIDKVREPGHGASRPTAGRDDRWTLHRVVQIDGRRYSLNLEWPFWQVLEALARDRHMRVNRLVGEIAADGAGAANLASRIRAYCVSELHQHVQRSRLALMPANVVSLIAAAPFPALVISARQEVLLANPAFADWLGVPGARLVGRRVQRNFRFRMRIGFDELWRAFAEGRSSGDRGRIVSIVPGRVRAADVTLQPVQFGAFGDFACVVWLQIGHANPQAVSRPA